MPIVFSVHAVLQLKRRKISKRLVIEAVENSEDISSSFKSRKLRRESIGGKILEIVTKTEGNKITVITAYYLRSKNEN